MSELEEEMLQTEKPKEKTGPKPGYEDIMHSYMRNIGEFELLDPEGEKRLSQIIRKNHPIIKEERRKQEENPDYISKVDPQIFSEYEEARKTLIQSNLRLVVKIAHDFMGLGLPISDLISEGNIGLTRAAEKFDHEKGAKFSSYGAWWIKQSMRRAIANQNGDVRVPVQSAGKIRKLKRTFAILKEKNGKDPTNQEISEATGISVRTIEALSLTLSQKGFSLQDKILRGEEGTYEEIFEDERASNAYQLLETSELKEYLPQLVEKLPQRTQEILKRRFGLDGHNPQTLEEVSLTIGRTRERVRQLQNQGLKELGELLKKTDGLNTKAIQEFNRIKKLEERETARKEKKESLPIKDTNKKPERTYNPAAMDELAKQIAGSRRLTPLKKENRIKVLKVFAENAGQVKGISADTGLALKTIYKIIEEYKLNERLYKQGEKTPVTKTTIEEKKPKEKIEIRNEHLKEGIKKEKETPEIIPKVNTKKSLERTIIRSNIEEHSPEEKLSFEDQVRYSFKTSKGDLNKAAAELKTTPGFIAAYWKQFGFKFKEIKTESAEAPKRLETPIIKTLEKKEKEPKPEKKKNISGIIARQDYEVKPEQVHIPKKHFQRLNDLYVAHKGNLKEITEDPKLGGIIPREVKKYYLSRGLPFSLNQEIEIPEKDYTIPKLHRGERSSKSYWVRKTGKERSEEMLAKIQEKIKEKLGKNYSKDQIQELIEDSLFGQEKEVVKRYVSGKTRKEISTELNANSTTVYSQFESGILKLLQIISGEKVVERKYKSGLVGRIENISGNKYSEQIIYEAIEVLPSTIADSIREHFDKGIDYKELAERENAHPDKIKSRIKFGLEKIARMLNTNTVNKDKETKERILRGYQETGTIDGARRFAKVGVATAKKYLEEIGELNKKKVNGKTTRQKYSFKQKLEDKTGRTFSDEQIREMIGQLPTDIQRRVITEYHLGKTPGQIIELEEREKSAVYGNLHSGFKNLVAIACGGKLIERKYGKDLTQRIEDNSGKKVTDREIKDALEYLSPLNREIIEGYFYQKKQLKEICEEKGIKISRVSSRITYCIKQLKKIISANEEGNKSENKYDIPRKVAEAFEETGSIYAAAKKAGVSYSTARKYVTDEMIVGAKDKIKEKPKRVEKSSKESNISRLQNKLRKGTGRDYSPEQVMELLAEFGDSKRKRILMYHLAGETPSDIAIKENVKETTVKGEIFYASKNLVLVAKGEKSLEQYRKSLSERIKSISGKEYNEKEITQAIEQVSEHTRKTMQDYFYNGISYGDLAKREGVGVATIRCRVSSGLERAISILNDEKSKLKKEKKEMVYEAYTKIGTIDGVSRETGVAPKTIKKYLNESGIILETKERKEYVSKNRSSLREKLKEKTGKNFSDNEISGMILQLSGGLQRKILTDYQEGKTPREITFIERMSEKTVYNGIYRGIENLTKIASGGKIKPDIAHIENRIENISKGKYSPREIKNALNNLPEKTRETLSEYLFESKTYKEMAEEKGVTRFCIAARINYGIKILTQALEENDKPLGQRRMEERKTKILDSFKKTGSILEAAKKAGVSYPTAKKYVLQAMEDFPEETREELRSSLERKVGSSLAKTSSVDYASLYEKYNGNVQSIAAELGVTKRVVYYNLKKENINGDESREDKIDEAKKIYRKTGSITETAKMTGHSYSTIQRWVEGTEVVHKRGRQLDQGEKLKIYTEIYEQTGGRVDEMARILGKTQKAITSACYKLGLKGLDCKQETREEKIERIGQEFFNKKNSYLIDFIEEKTGVRLKPKELRTYAEGLSALQKVAVFGYTGERGEYKPLADRTGVTKGSMAGSRKIGLDKITERIIAEQSSTN